MHDLFVPYHASLLGLLALAGLVLSQFAVADFMLIRERHVPGMPVTAGHDSFLFRVTRAHANTNDNLGLLLLLVLLCLFSGANPQWTNAGIWVFVGARVAHMICYYADLRTMRSTAFVFGTIAELGLFVAAVQALCQS